jgi:hypothetical protein
MAAAGAVFVLLGNVIGAWGRVEPFFYVSSGYLKEATQPILVVSLRNTIEIIEARQEAIRVRIEMASARLRVNPDDPIIKDALEAANEDWREAEFQKSETQCSIRQAQGLGCGR